MATFDQSNQRVGSQLNGPESGDTLYEALFGNRGAASPPPPPRTIESLFGGPPTLPPSHDGPGGGHGGDESGKNLGKVIADMTINAMIISSKALALLNQLALSPARLTPNQRAKVDELAAAFSQGEIEHIWGQEA